MKIEWNGQIQVMGRVLIGRKSDCNLFRIVGDGVSN